MEDVAIDVDPAPALIGFARALRAAGLAVGPHRTQTFLQAAAHLGAGARRNVYWAGRATLCAAPDDIAVYDATFTRWFTADEPHRPSSPRPAPRTVQQAALVDGDEGTGAEQDRLVAVMASADEALRHRDIAELTASERRRLARLFTTLPVHVPTRRALRRKPAHAGDIDPARTVRDQLRHAGEPSRLRHRRTADRPRRIVMLIDVSGSMEPYADSLLRLAHRIVRAAPRTTEVFTLGTRLTRVTGALHVHDPDRALLLVGETVPDWSGGTRLGESLRAFLDRWGQRGAARSAVVVIASDGWEVGDAALLGAQMARLHRLAHTVVWANPHRGKAGYAPVQAGIVAALPWLDALVAGHSLASFRDLLEVIAHA